ncbi:diphosphomevalonate decarboxylase [Secundilactobacillus kimchicus]|uniref:diphosphomevalonate decarboxylase n=1 Tax=Secundilactobacillus kimchicus TaxID=528209 RepID=UPI001C028BC5|nr:diphosphomevalonate decarboxylase [Secundilactobacillus kimchicus]MBT9672864.1 diphosphomevalonate decarboxylase [Secundilactobacillus kimchicus]
MTTPTNQKITATAHTNIALVKYWGKADQSLIIPQTDSLSLTLKAFYTTTSVVFDPRLSSDTITFDGVLASHDDQEKMSRFLDLVRAQADVSLRAAVTTVNHVPVAAGLASSASGYAALAAAASRAAGLNLSRHDLSRLARRGSGSASRSVFGGFAAWHRGTDDATSYAYPIDEQPDWDLGVMAVVLDQTTKKISSRTGMQRSVATSPFYPAWIKANEQDFDAIQVAIKAHDIESLGQITEHNALRMHALTLSAEPGFTYFNGATLAAIELVQQTRQELGGRYYFTIDAGPNVKIIGLRTDLETQLLPRMQAHFGAANVLLTAAGPGVTIQADNPTGKDLNS